VSTSQTTTTLDLELEFPDEMDVNVTNWPEPVDIDVDAEIPEETVNLPLIDLGGGGGSCPASPTSPIGFGKTFVWDIQPLCDLATMLRPILLAFAGLASLGIALGRI
jgi:hypothetical protein